MLSFSEGVIDRDQVNATDRQIGILYLRQAVAATVSQPEKVPSFYVFPSSFRCSDAPQRWFTSPDCTSVRFGVNDQFSVW